jgi:hypothetical protein
MLTESGNSHHTILTYDENDGMLLSMLQETQNGSGTIRVELKLTDQKQKTYLQEYSATICVLVSTGRS